jgi:hypothetical protein
MLSFKDKEILPIKLNPPCDWGMIGKEEKGGISHEDTEDYLRFGYVSAVRRLAWSGRRGDLRD